MAKTTRKNPSKRLRFDVFKRDSFTCQYCGAQPPEVVLVCDHIDPVVNGGKTSIDNLITACESCNQGKAGKVLSDRVVRPDADLLYLEVQQELVELKRFQAAERLRDEALESMADDLLSRWCSITGEEYGIAPYIFIQMLRRYSPEIVNQAVVIAAKQEADGKFKWNLDAAVPYTWGVAKRISERMEEQGGSIDG